MIEQHRDIMALVQKNTHSDILLHAASGGELDPHVIKNNLFDIDPFAEERYPTGSAYHFNYYQRNLPFRGAETKPPGAHKHKDLTSTTDHFSIDDDATVATDLKDAIKEIITQ
jgi:hypothetical protein